MYVCMYVLIYITIFLPDILFASSGPPETFLVQEEFYNGGLIGSFAHIWSDFAGYTTGRLKFRFLISFYCFRWTS